MVTKEQGTKGAAMLRSHLATASSHPPERETTAERTKHGYGCPGEEDREVERGIAKLQVHGIGACCPSGGTSHGEAMAAVAAPQAAAAGSARREEENEGSNDALGWLLALFTRAWAWQ
jgi:hypothetical protein